VRGGAGQLPCAIAERALGGVDPIAFGAAGASRDTRVFEAGADEGVYVAPLDLDTLREWRRREVWGGAYRRPGCYGRLTDEGSAAPKGMLDK
jgi:predicted amidohydrolase